MRKTNTIRLIHHAKTPRAAGIAGILFGILFSVSIVIMMLSMPGDMTDMNAWTDATRSRIAISLDMIPFAGLAFQWFVGVVRDKMGTYEDQFFATVVQGSGLLFLAMSFCAFAIGAGMLTAYSIGGNQVLTSNLYLVNQSIMSQIFNTYAIKMAAVFMFSLSTLWLRTGAMPRALSFFTYLMAIVMFVSLSRWMVVLFPAWVFCVSLYILALSFGRRPSGSMDGMSPQPEGN
jgi:hypothetical protein